MLNHITLMGNLTKDVEVKTVGDKKVVNNTIAVRRDFAPEGQPDTDFIDIAVWGPGAERMGKYLSKGSAIVVDGRLQIDNYTDRDGKSRNAASVRVQNWYFGERKAAAKDAAPAEPAPDADVGGEVEFPF